MNNEVHWRNIDVLYLKCYSNNEFNFQWVFVSRQHDSLNCIWVRFIVSLESVKSAISNSAIFIVAYKSI